MVGSVAYERQSVCTRNERANATVFIVNFLRPVYSIYIYMRIYIINCRPNIILVSSSSAYDELYRSSNMPVFSKAYHFKKRSVSHISLHNNQASLRTTTFL
jgi:hypothetical protein